MDYAAFLRLLHESVCTRTDSGKRQIIRFRKKHEFRKCLHEWNRLKSSLKNLTSIQPLVLIQGFSCSLHSFTVTSFTQSCFILEEDVKIRVHAPTAALSKPPIQRSKYTIPWGVKHIRAPGVWSKATGKRIKVGVIDTGIDFFHPDLRGGIARGVNLIQRSMLPYDDNGHGTHIAGTIAAANAPTGMIGVAPNAIIHPVKAFDHNGSAYVSDIILGIDWCVRNHIHVINMSFGMKGRSKALEEAVKRAYRAGVIIVASSGNDGKAIGIDYPARFPQTISVGATNQQKKIAPFSNRGKRVDLYAPGDKISSTWINGKYNLLSGTSMATSHVTGIIALMLESKPHLTPAEIKSVLKLAARPIKTAKAKIIGEVDALRTIKQLRI